MNPLAAALAERAAREPRRTALLFRDRALDFAALAARAANAARWLAVRGVASGDRVATLLGNVPAFVELWHGAQALGAVLVPCNVRLAPPELAYQLRDAEPALLVCGADELAEKARIACAGLASPPPTAEVGTWLPETQARVAPAPSDPDPIAAIVYTSGTTGAPKGAMLPARAFAASAAASRVHLGVRAGDRWLACLPLFHVGGLAMLARSAADGVAVELHERFDERIVASRLGSGEVEWASLVPTMLARILAASDREAHPALRGILLGGAAAPDALQGAAAKRGFPVAPTYGLTEAASQVATRPPGASGRGAIPLPGTRVAIADDGEILVAGPTLMRGYWRRPDATASALRGGWLHTGDLGFLDERGALHVQARRSDLIVSGGENVYPAEIEAALAEHPALREVAVAGVPDAEFGARPAAWFVTDGEIDASELRAFCRARLAGYKVPVAFHRVAELPRGASGKVLREQLRERGNDA